MDKISGILPSNARVKSVDLKQAPPARPGMPTFGRAEGVSPTSRHLPTEPDIFQKAMRARHQVDSLRAKSEQQANIAKHMAEAFFHHRTNIETADDLKGPANLDVGPTMVANVQHFSPTADAELAPSLREPVSATTREELDQPEVGRYLNVQA